MTASFGRTNDGLHYSETIDSEFTLTPYKWANKSKLSDNYFKRFTNENGTSTLAEMALRSCVRYRHALTSEVLADIPWDSLGQKLWDKMVAMKAVTVAVWKAFVQGYQSNPQAQETIGNLVTPRRLPYELLEPSLPLISGNPISFLTILYIVNAPTDISGWMTLCALTNLRALFIVPAADGAVFDTRIARSWAAHARDEGAFPQLHSFHLSSIIVYTMLIDIMIELSTLPNLEVLRLKLGYLNPRLKNSGWREVSQELSDPTVVSSKPNVLTRMLNLNTLLETNYPSKENSPKTTLLVQCVNSDGEYNTPMHSDLTRSNDMTTFVRDPSATIAQKAAAPESSPEKSTNRRKIRKLAHKEMSDVLSSFQT